MHVEEIRGTETELQREIEGEGNHQAGTWAVDSEEAELASPPGPRHQPQRSVKVYPVWPGRRDKWFHDYRRGGGAAPSWGSRKRPPWR